MIDHAFGLTLKALRIERGLSQEDFAIEAGLHRTYVSQLERGLKSPSLRTLQRIAAVLQLPLSEFLHQVEAQHDHLSPNN